MNENEVAKKIVTYLDEKPLNKSIESRLAQAREKAMLKYKEKQFIEIEDNESNILILKNKFYENKNWTFLYLITLTLMLLMIIPNPLKDKLFPNEESMTLASPDFEEFLGSLHEKNQEFQVWDNKIDKLLNENDNE